ncbi:hypothetical protein L0152_13915 [bacterium]|nr:hypothetical protein [bacterium]
MVKQERTTTQFERQVFRFLNRLRDSDKINMFEATPVIMKQYGLEHPKARYLWQLWAKNFNEEGKYDLIDTGIEG